MFSIQAGFISLLKQQETNAQHTSSTEYDSITSTKCADIKSQQYSNKI